ncbi:MAG: LysR family transcriptional regulator [Desulfarculaceae bacterium]|nr:LysR family transcriptional regulator [Desulfarculaceae bacterium]
MDIWQLKIFTSVVDEKSFSKASRAIHLSQPTVSSHIKELEEYFGCPLLDRLGREVTPTKAGKILYAYSKKIIALTGKAEYAVSEFLGRIRGELAIGGSTIPSGYIIPALIGPFTEQYPEVSISLFTGDTDQIIRQIEAGDMEIGIVGAKSESMVIEQVKLVDDEMKLVVPADHPWSGRESVTCSMLFGEPYLGREEGSGTWKSVALSMKEKGFDPQGLNIRVRLGNTASVIQGILNRAGISILSTMAVHHYVETGLLKTLAISDLDLDRCFYLTTHRKRTLSPVSKTFAEFAGKKLRNRSRLET